jgi:hypothetical protein
LCLNPTNIGFHLVSIWFTPKPVALGQAYLVGKEAGGDGEEEEWGEGRPQEMGALETFERAQVRGVYT